MTQNYELNGYLESRLTEWANWVIDIYRGNLGWPKKSLIAEVMKMGVLVRTSDAKYPIMNERAEEVDFWVHRLNRSFPQYAEALASFYCNPQLPYKALAFEMDVSISTLKARIHQGKVWLSGHIDAKESQNDGIFCVARNAR